MKIIAGVVMVYAILCAILLAGKKDTPDELLYIMTALLMAIYMTR